MRRRANTAGSARTDEPARFEEWDGAHASAAAEGADARNLFDVNAPNSPTAALTLPRRDLSVLELEGLLAAVEAMVREKFLDVDPDAAPPDVPCAVPDSAAELQGTVAKRATAGAVAPELRHWLSLPTEDATDNPATGSLALIARLADRAQELLRRRPAPAPRDTASDGREVVVEAHGFDAV